MIKAIFQLDSNSFTSKEIILPAVPSVGNQIFLGDFIDEGEERKIFEKGFSQNLDSLIVKHVTWLKSPKDKQVYILITLEV